MMARKPEPVLAGLDREPTWLERSMHIAAFGGIALLLLAIGYQAGLSEGIDRGFIEGQIAELDRAAALLEGDGENRP